MEKIYTITHISYVKRKIPVVPHNSYFFKSCSERFKDILPSPFITINE